MLRELRGARILITGASSGIGQALAEQAARAGARVVLTARSADTLEELAVAADRRGGRGGGVPADLTSDAERRRLVEAAAERFDGLDVLVNNAGVASVGHFADGTEAMLRQVMEVNFFAPAELIRLAIPVLTRGRQPAIVNVASMCGRRGHAGLDRVFRQQVRPVRPDRGAAGRVGALRHRRAAGRAGPDAQRLWPATCCATRRA